MININGYKNSEWKDYTFELTFRWGVTATSKKSAQGMINDEIMLPVYTGDNEVIDPKEIKIIKVFSEESGELLYERV